MNFAALRALPRAPARHLRRDALPPVLLRQVARDLGQRLVQERLVGGGPGGLLLRWWRWCGGGRRRRAARARRRWRRRAAAPRAAAAGGGSGVAALASSAPLSAGSAAGGGSRGAASSGAFGAISGAAGALAAGRSFALRAFCVFCAAGSRGASLDAFGASASATWRNGHASPLRHFPFAKKRQACFDFFFFFAAGASAAAGAAAAGAAAVASSERFNIRTVGVALLLRAAARAAAQALVAAIMSNAKESCASITASEGMVDGEPCDCCFCGARRDLLPFPLSLGAMLASRERCWPAVACASPGGSAICGFCGEQFASEFCKGSKLAYARAFYRCHTLASIIDQRRARTRCGSSSQLG